LGAAFAALGAALGAAFASASSFAFSFAIASFTVSSKPSRFLEAPECDLCCSICSSESLLSWVSSLCCSASRVDLALAACFPSSLTSSLSWLTVFVCLLTMSSASAEVLGLVFKSSLTDSASESCRVTSSSLRTLFCSIVLAARSWAISWPTVASSLGMPPCTHSRAVRNLEERDQHHRISFQRPKRTLLRRPRGQAPAVLV
jgi:hypothetical protein